MGLTVGSLFAGIGGFDLAAERAGMTVAWQSEIDKQASKVLAHHWPNTPNYGDIHDMVPGLDDIATVDVLTGGFPCQDYSVAGTRGGLAGDRGALWWEYHRLITALRPTWVIGENVPGLLSSRDGADFETIVGSLVELGYGVVWAILDAQYFGVAQRRRRVFIVGHSGGQPRPEVLALGEGLYGHPEPRRETREGTTGATPFGTRDDREVSPAVVTPTGGLSAKQNQFAYVLHPDDGGVESGALKARAVEVAATLSATEGERSTDRGVRIVNALTAKLAKGTGGPSGDETNHLVFAQNQRNELRDLGDLAGAVAAEPGMKQQTYLATAATPSVRRLTPLECERLQGFPDGWTDIPSNKNTNRYRQLGNAVCVPVVEWILRNIT